MARLFLTIIIGLLGVSSLACLRSPQPIDEEFAYTYPHYVSEPPSIDEQIFISDVIVVASFVSAEAGVETIPGGLLRSPTYRPKQILNFRAIEFLKGTGPNEFTVEVVWDGLGIYTNGDIYDGYLKESEALRSAMEALTNRNTAWDDQTAVLFLLGDLASLPSESGDSTGYSSQSFDFIQSNFGAQSNFSYSVDTLSRTWLPAKPSPYDDGSVEHGGADTSGDTEFIIDGAKTPPAVMTLSALKTRIEEIEAMLVAGANKEGYEQCLYHKITRERAYRDHTPLVKNATTNSGIVAGTALRQSPQASDEQYNLFSVSGPDAERFQVPIRDDDTVASNGYYYDYVIARPLPAGEYSVNFHIQHYKDVVCDHNPTENNYVTYNVTVTAPEGTVHEAFFDPTAAGTGDVSPASFTVNGTATEITGLTWSDGKVGLSLNPYVSLAGYTLDFIELDGTSSLNLPAADATDNPEAKTLTWPVPNQPWQPGDQLMLRIREDSAPPPPTHTP